MVDPKCCSSGKWERGCVLIGLKDTWLKGSLEGEDSGFHSGCLCLFFFFFFPRLFCLSSSCSAARTLYLKHRSNPASVLLAFCLSFY